MKAENFLLIFLLSLLIGGCASTNSNSGASSNSRGPSIEGSIPANVPFAKIMIGMSPAQVHSILGMPSDQQSFITLKNFIPFYFGSDRVRTNELYKGVGRITYASGAVYKATYDPSEDGFQELKKY